MSDFILVVLLVVLLVCLIGTIGALIVYSGLLCDVIIKTGPPPVKNVTIAYKFNEGSYKDCGAAYTECCSIGPKLSTVGVFYDDPKQRPAEKCRYVVGSVLCEGEEKPDEELQKMYEKYGFKLFSLPEVSHAVTTSFPCCSPLSHVVGPYRVYPRLTSYIEICGSDVINYMVPLSRQTDFFVPEMKEEVKADVKEEDSDEDRGTDITGADSHSDVSSVSSGVPWDSRETSLAASTAASLVSSLPLRDHRDNSERGSNESVAAARPLKSLTWIRRSRRREEREEKGDAGEAGVPEGEDGAREAVELVAEKTEPLGDGEE
ncbi:hypothetical protein F7725_017119 [Dissostichus mawsoni]|uniref:Testis expressed 264, ER-phagy receptor a n=1 Tax=Dissostichus mawsoni TaxID=36200 RepID=A0A7J5Z494_DISMA|nr:hypothetical protein F7725_017119 [Dissostichus mawsoni]